MANARKLGRILSDLDAKVVVVERRGRLARFGVEHLEAAWSARGGWIVVAGPGERTDDLVGDVIDVLTLTCALRGARNRAMRGLPATAHGPGQAP
jgi:putative resolvase